MLVLGLKHPTSLQENVLAAQTKRSGIVCLFSHNVNNVICSYNKNIREEIYQISIPYFSALSVAVGQKDDEE